MRVCSKCGTPDNGAGVCPNCKSISFRTIGVQSNNSYAGNVNQYNNMNNQQYYSGTAVNNQYQKQMYSTNQPNSDYDSIYGLPSTMSDVEKMTLNQNLSSADTLGTIALVLGIVFCWSGIGTIVAIILGAVGISKVNGLPMMPTTTPFEMKKKSAKNKCVLGIVMPFIIAAAFWLIIGLATAGLIGSAAVWY